MTFEDDWPTLMSLQKIGNELKKILTAPIKTPVGEMIAGATDDGICLFDFAYRKMHDRIRRRLKTRLDAELVPGDCEYFADLRAQIDEYFAGDRRAFDLPLVLAGTDFEESVWRELMRIPFGEVRTYMEQALVLENPGAVRAVARANGANCLAILVPCHRVIAQSGDLTGYSGGLAAKKRLLNLEGWRSPNAAQMTLFEE